MTLHQSFRLALTLALALLAQSLFAGEIVLFEGEDFQGNSLVFRDTVSNLEPTGFNDRTASISVRDLGQRDSLWHRWGKQQRSKS